MNSDAPHNSTGTERTSRRIVLLAIITILAGILAVLSILNDSAYNTIIYKAF